jgi:hypothetical protein
MVARAGVLAQSANIPPLDVLVHFIDGVSLGKRDRDRVARSLLALVSNNVPADGQSVNLEMWRHPDEAPPGVQLVRVFRSAILRKHHWAVPDAGWVQSDFVEELQQAIDEKNARHAKYKSRCDECWLLVAASGGKPSGLFEPSDDTKKHIYRSSFAKTFFMAVFDQVLIELKTMPV